jgi:transposase-like protein
MKLPDQMPNSSRTLFPNEASVLRLVMDMLVELSDVWKTETRYLTMQTAD